MSERLSTSLCACGCGDHPLHNRKWINGHRPIRGPRTPAQTRARFMGSVKIDEATGCWEWQAYRTSKGYGHFIYLGRTWLAHRVAYDLLVGPIPEGRHLDHLCRNRACVNPAHLEPVTHRENTLRGEGFAAVNAAKTACSKGHPLDGENTYVAPNGSRECRTCRRERRRIEQPCRVPGCERRDVIIVDLWIGGEVVRAAFCPPHGAEYRIDEVRAA